MSCMEHAANIAFKSTYDNCMLINTSYMVYN